MTAADRSWSTHDYVSPGLRVVRPDEAFPHLTEGDNLRHPWKYLRRDVPHKWYVDERYPLMGFLNRDEAAILHNLALQFAGRRALEIGGWLGWSTCHLALAGVVVDVVDPAHEDNDVRAAVEASLASCGVADLVRLRGGRSPQTVVELASVERRRWSLIFIDGDHDGSSPARDAMACLPLTEHDCAFVFHDLASPSVAAALRALADEGFQVGVYQTAQLMGVAWRGAVRPPEHVPDPAVAWQVPAHLLDLPVMGVGPALESTTEYMDLADVVGSNRVPARPSVCIVTNELVGPFKNGGIGTSMTGLAETLAAEGLSVTVLYTGNVWTPDVSIGQWRPRYRELGIELVALDFDQMRSIAGPVRDCGFAAPFLVYQFLSSRHFDVVHFNDCCGDGSLSLVAKRVGLAFGDSLFVTALHSPSEWVLEHNQTLPTSLMLSAYSYSERLSVSSTDVLWCPSRYLLNWVEDRGFELPTHTYVQQYCLPPLRFRSAEDGRVEDPVPAFGPTPPPREIVFFGRLEERKGLRAFCSVLHLLNDDLTARNVSVTFLGKAQQCAGIDSLDYIARQSSKWRFQTRIITDLGQPEALAYLSGGSKLAVMPAPVDNSPCTVYEALSLGVPFLASRAGGTEELVDPADRDHVLFDYSVTSLRDALSRAIHEGGWVARPAVSQARNRWSILRLHERWEDFRTPVATDDPPFRTVAAVVDHRPGDDLQETLRSLAACPWLVQRILVLDREGGPVTPGVTTIDLDHAEPRDLAREVVGLAEDTVLFLHSGVRVLAEPLSGLIRALDIGSAQGLIPAGRVTTDRGSRFIPPLGGSPAFSLYRGVTFTGAMLVRLDVLCAAMRGRPLAPESPFMGLPDFCVASGDRIWPYPDPVVEHPLSLELAVRSALPSRVAAYAGAPELDRFYMLAAGYGAANGEMSLSRRREVALALMDLGLAPVVRLASSTLSRARQLRGRRRSTAVRLGRGPRYGQ